MRGAIGLDPSQASLEATNHAVGPRHTWVDIPVPSLLSDDAGLAEDDAMPHLSLLHLASLVSAVAALVTALARVIRAVRRRP